MSARNPIVGQRDQPKRRLVTTPFTIGQEVRYKPGTGVYGYEESIGIDGRIAARVLGFTATRVRVELELTIAGRRSLKPSAVDADSLIPKADLR